MSEQASAPAAPQAAPSALDVGSAPQNIDQLAQAIDQKNAPQSAPVEAPKVETPKQEAKRLKSLQLKVYGETVNEELPFEFEDKPEVIEYLTKQLQMSKAAQRAMQEKGSFEKQVNSFVENLKGNTAQVLAQLGIDPVEFGAQVLEQEIEKQKLSPEERKNRELEAKLKNLEEEGKRKEDEMRKKEYDAHRRQTAERVENQMIQALDKSDLPHTPYVADRIAKYMLLALNDPEGPIELSPEDVIPLVREDILNDIQHVIKGMSKDPSKLENFIGKDVFSQVRKSNIEKLKTQTPATAKAAIKEVGNQQKAELKPKEVSKLRARDFFGI